MKMKKLKLLMNAVASIAKRDIKEIKGVNKTNYFMSQGHPLVLLPTKGKYLLPEIRTINKIIMSIEPVDLEDEARKVNFQSGILLMSVINMDNNVRLVLVHTPYGCCAYNAFINEKKQAKLTVEIDNDLKDKFEIL
jgi:hypothetical protein